MNLSKPKFWDKNKTFIFPILLLPITILINLVGNCKKLFIKKQFFSIPIICIGNIYLGGTGKTPFSIKLFSILKNLNKNPAFIRKKYVAFQDEVQLQKKVGPIYENNKRTQAIKEAIKNKADVAILDDGFQDFSINKSLSIICFNEEQWIGNGFLIPSGPLRESLSSLKRADYVIINGEKNINIEKKIFKENKLIKIYYTKYEATNIDEFKNKKIIGFAGIGNPINFFNLLKENNIEIIEEKEFPDHHNYSGKEIENLINKAKEKNAILLTTEKDYFRLNKNYKKNVNFLKIMVEVQNKNQFIEEIKKII